MENDLTPAIVDARRVAAVVRELSFDLLRAIEAAVPSALADVAAALGPERLSRISERVFREAKARYAVNAAATLIAAHAGDRP